MEPVLVLAAAAAALALAFGSKKQQPTPGDSGRTSWLVWSTNGGMIDGKAQALASYSVVRARTGTPAALEEAAKSALQYGDPWLSNALRSLALKAGNASNPSTAIIPGAPSEGGRWTQELAAILLSQQENPEPVTGWNANRLMCFSRAYESMGLTATAGALSSKGSLMGIGQAVIPAIAPTAPEQKPNQVAEQSIATMVASALASRNPAVMRQTATILRQMGYSEQAARLEQQAAIEEAQSALPSIPVPAVPAGYPPVSVPVPALPLPTVPAANYPPTPIPVPVPTLPLPTVPATPTTPTVQSNSDSVSLAAHLATSKRGTENKKLVSAYQAKKGLTADGKYGPAVGKAIANDGVVPPKPFYWPASNTQGSLDSWNQTMVESAGKYPDKAGGFMSARANWSDVSASSGTSKSTSKSVLRTV